MRIVFYFFVVGFCIIFILAGMFGKYPLIVLIFSLVSIVVYELYKSWGRGQGY